MSDVTTYVDNHNIMRTLIKLLDDFFESGSPNPIPEIVHLNQMSETGCLPGENFYPRAIITYMMNRHGAFMEDVCSNPRLARKFICVCHDENGRRAHEFSNTMPLYADIITLKYLYVLHTRHPDCLLQIRELVLLMLNKYMLFEDVFCETYCMIYCVSNEPHHPKMITLRRIYRSFLSVTLWMYSYIPEFTTYVRNIFPFSSLPPMIGSPNFPLILSTKIEHISSYIHLLAVNMATCVAHDPYPIFSIVQHVMQCCTSFDVYTEDMRIDVCIKLGIAINRNGVYCFLSTFEMSRSYYIISMYKIRRIRHNDETYNETLEHLRLLFP